MKRDIGYKLKTIRLIFQLSRPLYLVFAIMLYLLGIGIFRYLIGVVYWSLFFLGLMWVVFIMLGFQYLNEYFYSNSFPDIQKWWQTPFSGDTGAIGPGKISRQLALWVGLTCITISASLTILIIQNQGIGAHSVPLLIMFFLGELLFALPPIRLVSTVFGEFSLSLLLTCLIPAIAFAIQGHELHKLLFMVSFPLFFLFLGMVIALEFPTYAYDLNHACRTLLVRIGWQRGMLLHNLLIMGSLILFGIAAILGLPESISWPLLLVFPLAIFQIWMMVKISNGGKPNWNLHILISLSTFISTTYLLAYSFWTH